jgi:RNA polymerase sigma factor (sigma-70 family)
MKNLIDSAPISDKQRQQLIMYYYDNKTLAEIGTEFSVTREAVRQNIQKALNTIRESINQ